MKFALVIYSFIFSVCYLHLTFSFNFITCFLERVAINPLNYLSFPKHEMSLSIKIVRLGATDFYATKQLLPFVSTKSLQQAKNLQHLVRTALGRQPVEMKTVSK